REFDVRVAWSAATNDWRVAHGALSYNSLDQDLAEVTTWLDQHPHEFVVLRMHTCYNSLTVPPGCTPKEGDSSCQYVSPAMAPQDQIDRFNQAIGNGGADPSKQTGLCAHSFDASNPNLRAGQITVGSISSDKYRRALVLLNHPPAGGTPTCGPGLPG